MSTAVNHSTGPKRLDECAADIARCPRCSICKFIPLQHITDVRWNQACPSIIDRGFHAYSAGGRMDLAASLLEGRSEMTAEVLDAVYRCTMCGVCDVSCKTTKEIEVLEVLEALRTRAVDEGCGPMPAQRQVLDHVRATGNLAGARRETAARWSAGTGVDKFPGAESDTLFYAGCKLPFSMAGVTTLRRALRLLESAGVGVAVLGDGETTCGGFAHAVGDQGLFEECARENIERFSRVGVRRLVTADPECFATFRRLYPRMGTDLEVLHISQVLAEAVRKGRVRLTRRIPLHVTYHDPCHLGRLSEPQPPWDGTQRKVLNQLVITEPPKQICFGNDGVYDEPRSLLAAIPGIELVEMHRRREFSFCCGAGAGCDAAFPEFAARTARIRLDEAVSTGADAVVTACGGCQANLGSAADGTSNMVVLDLVDLVAEAAGIF